MILGTRLRTFGEEIPFWRLGSRPAPLLYRQGEVTVAYQQLQTSAGVGQRLAAVLVRWGIPTGAVVSVAVGLEWVRFGMRTPSLIDDWFGITYGPRAAHALVHGDYASSHVDFAGRYRPAYTAVWNYVQWHLLGGPSVDTAAAWGMFRVAVFLLAVWLLTAGLVGKRARVARPLLWLAPLAVVMTPAIAVDLSRYGPTEPMMIAGLIIGISLIGCGVRTLLSDQEPARNRLVAAALVTLGYPVYLFGVYSKEASFCLLAFIPFLMKWHRASPRRYGTRSRTERLLLGALAIFMVVPLVHVAAHLAVAAASGERPYPTAAYSLGRKLFAAGVSPLLGWPDALGTWLWFAAAPGAIIVAVAAARRRDSDAWLLFGVLVTGFLMSAVALARGETPSRYYIPWLVAVAAVAFRGLARANLALQVSAVVLVVVLGQLGVRNALGSWARTERDGSTSVEMAKGILRAGCPLYLANFDLEQRVAIPLLFPLAHARRIPDCMHNSQEAYVLSWENHPLAADFADRCRSQWRPLTGNDSVGMYRCQSLRFVSTPDQVAASGDPHVTVVRVRLMSHLPDPRTLHQPGVVGARS
jgi:hypothetical protein